MLPQHGAHRRQRDGSVSLTLLVDALLLCRESWHRRAWHRMPWVLSALSTALLNTCIMLSRRDPIDEVVGMWQLSLPHRSLRLLKLMLLGNGFVRHKPINRGHAARASAPVIAEDQSCSFGGGEGQSETRTASRR